MVSSTHCESGLTVQPTTRSTALFSLSSRSTEHQTGAGKNPEAGCGGEAGSDVVIIMRIHHLLVILSGAKNLSFEARITHRFANAPRPSVRSLALLGMTDA